jgi:eukaryotic-like serine/threonine-protein kinase
VGNFDDRYQMVGRLGEGGMGEVWLAHDEQLSNRPVAIKIMRAQLAPGGEEAARFDREMRLAAQMQHPNIVTLFTTGTFNGAPYMVMEYLEGHDLAKEPPVGGVDQIVTIGGQTCAALAYAHERNVIHRDIKPGNLFLCKTGQTKVTDFGIAKAMTGTKLSSSGVLVGTFAYMSPEQWLGEPAAFSNDIWAVGCALYEFLAGRVPREYGTVGEYAAAAVRGEAIPDLRSVARVPDWLGGVVMAMLDPNASNRPTVDQCAQLLSGAGAGTPSGAWPTDARSAGARSAGQALPGLVGLAAASTSQRLPATPAGTATSSWPSGPATPPPTYVPDSGHGWGNGQPPVPVRGKKGRVVAVVAGVAVLLIAGLSLGRGAIFGSSTANNTTAGGGATPPASSPAVSASVTPSSASSASSSSTAGAIAGSSPGATGAVTLTGATTQVAVGAAPSFTYTAQSVASGETVELQRTFGQTYEDLVSLSGANGPVTAPALDAMGKYSFRVAIESDGTVVSTSAPVTVEAYGTVQLVPFNDGSGTVQVGNRLFPYTDNQGASQYPQYQQNQAWTASTCQSMTVQFTESTSGQSNNETAYLEFVQTATDPTYASAAPGTIKSVTVPLDGGPLYIDTSATDGDSIDFTATGSCYTPSGQPQGS